MDHTSRLLRLSSATLVVAAVVACIPDPFEGICAGIFFSSRPCVALNVYPDSETRFLLGDTIRFSTFSDSGYGRVTWSVEGNAVRFRSGGAVVATVDVPDTTILVQGTDTGTAVLTASSVNSSYSVSRTLHVADSSAITRLVLSPQGVTLRLADRLAVLATLQDNLGRPHRGAPTGWHSTDTTVATVTQDIVNLFGQDFLQSTVRPQALGNAWVVATFLAVRDSLRVTIVP